MYIFLWLLSLFPLVLISDADDDDLAQSMLSPPSSSLPRLMLFNVSCICWYVGPCSWLSSDDDADGSIGGVACLVCSNGMLFFYDFV